MSCGRKRLSQGLSSVKNQTVWDFFEAAFSQTPWRLKHIYSLSKREKVNGLICLRSFVRLFELWVKRLPLAAAII